MQPISDATDIYLTILSNNLIDSPKLFYNALLLICGCIRITCGRQKNLHNIHLLVFVSFTILYIVLLVYFMRFIIIYS